LLFKIIEIMEITVGDKIPTFTNEYIKVMAFADNYYMVRYKGCVPFVCTKKELIQKIENNQPPN